jgi:hypothetical protein
MSPFGSVNNSRAPGTVPATTPEKPDGNTKLELAGGGIVAVPTGVAVGVAVGWGVGVAVARGVAVGAAVGVGVAVGAALARGVAVGVLPAMGVAVGVLPATGVAVAAGAVVDEGAGVPKPPPPPEHAATINAATTPNEPATSRKLSILSMTWGD